MNRTHGHRFGHVRDGAGNSAEAHDAPPGQVARPRVSKKRRDGLLVEAEPVDHRFSVLRVRPLRRLPRYPDAVGAKGAGSFHERLHRG